MKIQSLPLAGFLMMLFMTGCTVYPVLTPIPEYEPLQKKFDTSTPLYIYPFAKQEWINPMIRQAFAGNGYTGVAGKLPVQRILPGKAKVVVPMEFSQEVVPQEKGYCLDTRIIVMVRRPVIVVGSGLNAPSGKRFFQAWSRIPLKDAKADQTEYSDGARRALKNLFTIEPFRQALEPDKKIF